ncbi:MAG TPA: ATP-binding protein [Chloroflexota bacterium]|nr:ATP-binding protein [Chloroflexota bacterium]
MKDILRSADHSLTVLLGKQVRTARRRAGAVTLLRGVVDDAIGRAFLELLACLDRPTVRNEHPAGGAGARDSGRAEGVSDPMAAYARLFNLLACEAAPALEAADAWQSHLLWRLLADRNAFSVQAERVGPDRLPSSLLDQARRDLRGLQWLYALSADVLRDATVALVGDDLVDALAGWQHLAPPAGGDDERLELVRRLSVALDWGALAEEIAAHWHRHGLGLFAEFRAARWSMREGHLEGITHPDPARLDRLYAYDHERAPLLRNTERFIAGLPAQHVLLYGERGTGKSSTVKALLPAYGRQGLRLVELARDDLGDLSRVLAALRDRPQRFILFVDDLSFEEHELHYKALKAALEGTVEAWPDNVLLYVTTNRRHLIKERFADRQTGADDEVRPRDTMEEKLSLADRFGLLVTFPSPDQERYVTIVVALARSHGIYLSEAEIRRRAIQWALWHNGRSGRTARQFVDDLVGELSSAKEA